MSLIGQTPSSVGGGRKRTKDLKGPPTGTTRRVESRGRG